MQAVQCKMARAALGWSVRALAQAADVSPETVARLEQGDFLKERTVLAMRMALEAAGIQFIEPNGGGPGVRLRRQGPVDEGLRPDQLTSENDD